MAQEKEILGHVLIVDDNVQACHQLAEFIEEEGYRVVSAGDLATAYRRLEQVTPEVVITKLLLPDGDGMELLKALEDDEDIEVILITANASLETAVEALRLGAYDYLTRPVDRGHLKTVLANLGRARRLKREVNSLRGKLRKLGRFGPMIGTSPAMQQIYDLIEKVAPTSASFFIIGESGTGKEREGRWRWWQQCWP